MQAYRFHQLPVLPQGSESLSYCTMLQR